MLTAEGLLADELAALPVVACGPTGVAGAARSVLWAGLLGAPVGGGLPACCLLPRQTSDRRASCPPACRLFACVVACGSTGVAGAASAFSGRAAWCARGRRPARSPSALRASLGASARSPARPRHRPRAPQPGPPVLPAPSTPVGPGVLIVGLARRLVVRPGLATARSPHFVLCSRSLHPNRRHCTPSDRVQRAVTGVAPHRGACGRHGGAQWLVAKWCYTI